MVNCLRTAAGTLCQTLPKESALACCTLSDKREFHKVPDFFRKFLRSEFFPVGFGQFFFSLRADFDDDFANSEPDALPDL